MGKLYTTEDIRKLAGQQLAEEGEKPKMVSRSTVWRWRSQGPNETRLKSIRIHGSVRIREEDWLAFLEANMEHLSEIAISP